MGRGRLSSSSDAATLTVKDAPPAKNASKHKSMRGGIVKRSKDASKKAVQLLLQQNEDQRNVREPANETKWRKYFPGAREKKVGTKNVTINEHLPSRKRRSEILPRKRRSTSCSPDTRATTARENQRTPNSKDDEASDRYCDVPPASREESRKASMLNVRVKKIPVLNIADPHKNDTNGVNRMKFFSHRPKRFDNPNETEVMKLSPFAYTASLIEGHSAESVCAVCGNGDGLSFSCLRCPLAFHTPCIYPNLKPTDPIPDHCQACASSEGKGSTISNPRTVGLRRLTEDAKEGNPIDFVMHPSLQIVFAKRYQSDWLRCSKCSKFRMVPLSCLSECVKTPFECSSAFWMGQGISCDASLSTEHKHTSKTVNTLVTARSRRRARLFYSGFGEKDRELFDFEPLDKVVVQNEDVCPYRKFSLRNSERVIAKPPSVTFRHRARPPPSNNPLQFTRKPNIARPVSPTHSSPTSPVPQAHYGRGIRSMLHHRTGTLGNTEDPRIIPRSPAGPSGAGPVQPRQAPVDLADKEMAEERILARIGELQNLGPLEDILVDLAMTGNRELMRLYKAFWHCPARFNRQAIRLATFFFQRQSKARASAIQQRQHPSARPARPQSAPSQAVAIQKPPSLRERRLTASEREQLHERFRVIRLRQIAECVRLGQAMFKEMQSCTHEEVPKTHRSHAMAKRMMDDEHNKQIQKLVQATHTTPRTQPQAQIGLQSSREPRLL